MNAKHQLTAGAGSESCNTMMKGTTKTVVMNGSRILMKNDVFKWWNIQVTPISVGSV